MNHEQIAESCRHWAAQMHRAASAVEAESDGSMHVAAVIDGNRAVAETLAQAAEAVAKLARLRDLPGIAEREAISPAVGLSTFVRNPANGAMVAADDLLIDNAACASQFRQLADDADLRQAIKDNICTPLRRAAEGTVRCCQEYAANELEWFASMLRKGLGPIPAEKGPLT